MSLRETLQERLKDLNVSKLTIDRNASEHGRPATQVSFVMTDPAGMETGDLNFEIWLANNMGLDHDAMADLTHSYALNQARAYQMEQEVEI